MDNISDFFFLSVNDNDSKLINKNVQFDVNAIRNETHHTPVSYEFIKFYVR